MPLTPRVTLNAVTNRATGSLRLEWEYRHMPGSENRQQDELPASALDAALADLRAGGWVLESQCANPTRETYTETYTFSQTLVSDAS